MRKTADIRLTAAAAFILASAAAVNAQNIVNIKDSLYDGGGVDNINTVNAIDAADAVDTVNSINTADIVDNVDTVNTVNAVSAVNKDSSAAGKLPPRPPKPDAADPPLLSGAYWGFGAGLSVGTVPIFPMWQQYFPNSLRLSGLSPDFAADKNNGDTAQLLYRMIERPDAFNFAIPFRLSLYSVGEKHVFSLAVSFFRNSKEFHSTLETADAATRRINITERLAYYSASIEAAADWAIPSIFFSVDGTQQTFLSFALGLSPINSFTRRCEFENNFNNSDARMQSVADSVKKTFAAVSGNGLSLSWRAGVSVVKRYPSGYGAEFGLYYSGSYSGGFYSDGVRLTEDHIKTHGADLNAESVTGGKPLAFFSNQAEFRATLLVPAKKKN